MRLQVICLLGQMTVATKEVKRTKGPSLRCWRFCGVLAREPYPAQHVIAPEGTAVIDQEEDNPLRVWMYCRTEYSQLVMRNRSPNARCG